MVPYDQSITHAILDSSLDAVFTIRADGQIVDVNAAASRMFGWRRDELLGRNISTVVPIPMRGQHDGFLQHFDPVRGITHVLGNGRLLLAEHQNGSTFPVEVGISHFNIGAQGYFTGFVRDMSERQRHVDELQYLAHHDDDTGLLNYRGWIAALLARPQAPDAAVLYIQMNCFTRIIAAHGRPVGAMALCAIAARLDKRLTGTGAAIARVGEAAFAVHAEYPALALAEACLAEIQIPIAYQHTTLQISAQIGIAAEQGSSAERLRDAMTASEHLGISAGGILAFSSELAQQLKHAVFLESRLQHALERNALRLMLQPKLDLSTEQVVGAEALVRWQDEDLGLVSPLDFIGVAERSGLIHQITDWVLEHSLAEFQRYRHQGLSVAVNFSALDFQQSDVVDRVRQSLRQYDFDPALLEIEITESTVAQDPQATAARMRELKAEGIGLALDDFGTGYSSLAYLRQFPLDTLKIDASFVRNTPDTPDANAVAGAIAALARALNMQTVAEGVETRAQAEFLKSLSVERCQGFLFSRPLPPSEFHQYVAARR